MRFRYRTSIETAKFARFAKYKKSKQYLCK